MTNEEKELLLKDLCSRLPYGVKVQAEKYFGYGDIGVKLEKFTSTADSYIVDNFDDYETVKPYLRPMSSMTIDERLELSKLTNDEFKFYLYTNKPFIMCCSGKDYNYLNGLTILDWLNAHHFDYRGLIEKGLALEAHEGMYNN